MLEIQAIAIELPDRRCRHDDARRVRELDDVEREQQASAEGCHQAVIGRRGEGEEVDLGCRSSANDGSCDFAIGGGEDWHSEKDL